MGDGTGWDYGPTLLETHSVGVQPAPPEGFCDTGTP